MTIEEERLRDVGIALAVDELDEWLQITGAIERDTSWYIELKSIIEDSVKLGFRLGRWVNDDEKTSSDRVSEDHPRW